MSSRPLAPTTVKSLALAALAAGAALVFRRWKRSCAKREADKRLDERLEASFPASDAVAKY